MRRGPPVDMQPPADADGIFPAHPIDPFLDEWYGLDANGHADPPGYADYVQVYRALSLEGPWDLSRLKGVLRALLARDPSQVSRFNRCFDAFFEPGLVPDWLRDRLADETQFTEARAMEELERALFTQPSSPEVGRGGDRRSPALIGEPGTQATSRSPLQENSAGASSPDKENSTGRMLASARLRQLLLSSLLVVLVGLWLLRAPTQNLAVPSLTPAAEVGTPVIETVEALPKSAPPIILENERPPINERPPLRQTLAQLGLGLSLLLLAGGLRRFLTTLRPQPRVDASGTGELEIPTSASPLTLYDAGTLHRLAHQVGVSADDGLVELDARATVKATLRRGGLLEPVYRSLRMPSALRLVVPTDWNQEPIARQALEELRHGIEARGVAVRWEVYRAGRMPVPMTGVVTLFFLRGGQALPPGIPWTLPFSAFVELREPELWGPELAGVARRLHSLLPDDLMAALLEAAYDLRQTEQQHPFLNLSSLERLGSALPLAGVAALAGLFGPCTLAELDALRLELLPRSSPFWWQRIGLIQHPVGRGEALRTERVQWLSGHWSCGPTLADLLMDRLDPLLKLKVLGWQRERLTLLTPLAGSPAWERRQFLLDMLTVLELPLCAEQRESPVRTPPWWLPGLLAKGIGLSPSYLTLNEEQRLKGALTRLATLPEGSLAREEQCRLRDATGVAAPLLRWKETAQANPQLSALVDLSGASVVPRPRGRLPLSRPQTLWLSSIGVLGMVLLVVGTYRIVMDWWEPPFPPETPTPSAPTPTPDNLAGTPSPQPSTPPPTSPPTTVAVAPPVPPFMAYSSGLVPKGWKQVKTWSDPTPMFFLKQNRSTTALVGGKTVTQWLTGGYMEGAFLVDVRKSFLECWSPDLEHKALSPTRLLEFRCQLRSAPPFGFSGLATCGALWGKDVCASTGTSTSEPSPKADPSATLGVIPPVPFKVTPTPQPSEGVAPPSEEEKPSITWLSLPGGTFTMGSNTGNDDEKPSRSVAVSPFNMSKTEVTVAQYRACVLAKRCTTPNIGGYCNYDKEERADHPINCVDWNQAKAFAAWVGGRLPTEAEWEFAAKGEKGRKYPWGNEPEPSCDSAIYDPGASLEGATWGCGTGSTWPVCSKITGNTPEGLCDMAGNVWEWVEDCYNKDYIDAPNDGTERTKCSEYPKVLRGGGWNRYGDRLRATYRGKGVAAYRDGNVGFRIVRVPPVKGP